MANVLLTGKMVAVKIIVGICILGAIFSYVAFHGDTYYVSTTGSNGNDGSKEKPFASISEGVSHLQPGDTLVVTAGTYDECVNLDENVKGSLLKPITIRANDGDEVIWTSSGKKEPVLLTLDGASYVKVSGFSFQDTYGFDAMAVFITGGANHFEISNNTIKNIGYDTYEHATIDSEKDNAHAIFMLGNEEDNGVKDGLISGNVISNCRTGYSEVVTADGNVEGITIEGNTISNCTNIGIDIAGNYGECDNPDYDQARNCVIKNNTITGCISPYATSYGIYVDGGKDVEITGNTVKKCSGGIEVGAEQKQKDEKYATSDVIISKNTVEGNFEDGITIGGYKEDLGWVCDVTVKNNIIKNNGWKSGQELSLSKCHDIKITGNEFIHQKVNGQMVYSEMSMKYTYKISFTKNSYRHASSNFKFRNRNYWSVSSWKKLTKEK